jgi:hypothetical protein
LPDRMRDECRIINHIPVSEPARPADKPKQLFEPRSLHPSRGPWLRTSVKIKSRPDPYQRRCLNPANM